MIRVAKGDRVSLQVPNGPVWMVGPGLEQKVMIDEGLWTIVGTEHYDALRLRVQLAVAEAGDDPSPGERALSRTQTALGFGFCLGVIVGMVGLEVIRWLLP